MKLVIKSSETEVPSWNCYQSSQWEGTENTIDYSPKDTKERHGPDKSDGEEQSQDILENKEIYFQKLMKTKGGSFRVWS